MGDLVDNNDGTWTFTPEGNWNGNVEFTYDVSDGALSTSQTASLEVASADDGPTLEFVTAAPAVGGNLIQNGSFELSGGQDIVVDHSGSDELGTGWANGVTPDNWELISGDRWEVMGGNRHGIPGATDGDNVIDTGVGGREALVIAQTVTGLQDGQYLLELDLFDRGDSLNQPDSGNIDVFWNDELVATFNPSDNAFETGTVLIDVSGGSGQGVLKLASYNADSYGNVIDNVRLSPVEDFSSTGAVEVLETAAGGSYVATAIGSDVDSTDLEFSIQDGTPFDIDSETGVITLKDDAVLDGSTDPYTVDVTVTNGDGESFTRSLTVNVNEPPTSSDFTVSETADASGQIDGIVELDLLGNSDDVDGDVSEIIITDLPEGGTLYYNGQAVTDNDINGEDGTRFDASGTFTFEADSPTNGGVLLGVKTVGEQGLDKWGSEGADASQRVMTLENGVVITTAVTSTRPGNVQLEQYEQGQNHMGIGIGDQRGEGINAEDTVTMTFENGLVTSAMVGFDGLGGHFDAGSAQQAKASWVAKYVDENGNETIVGSGVVDKPDGEASLLQEVQINTDAPFNVLEFGTQVPEGTSPGSNWDLRYVETEFGFDTSVNFIPVDNDGQLGNESTATIDMTLSAPESASFTEVVDGDTLIRFEEQGQFSDDEDQVADMKVVIKSQPEHGHLEDGDGNTITDQDIQNGKSYDLDEITYVPDGDAAPDVSGAFIGATEEGGETIQNWGDYVDDNTRLLQVSDDVSIRVSSEGGPLEQYEGGASHIGIGLGIAGSEGITRDDTLTVEFEGAKVSHADVSFDGLGGHFVESGGDSIAEATWVAYDGDIEVARGTVVNDTPGLERVVSIGQDELGGKLFDRIEFSTDSTTNSNWELRYVDAEFARVTPSPTLLSTPTGCRANLQP
ncbi:cadherin-like domain-containing protein [Salidesulfovibrio brasiliensis]|uniref:cadherin-like domain-containing protein n=1 Tax=Salidesulfovibrio brasiliensis TaxID=221711 RepID=UPI0012ED41A2|nr:cadherin-like domain-containing protein [Salidesulfovibrio brasiliensis]